MKTVSRFESPEVYEVWKIMLRDHISGLQGSIKIRALDRAIKYALEESDYILAKSETLELIQLMIKNINKKYCQ